MTRRSNNLNVFSFENVEFTKPVSNMGIETTIRVREMRNSGMTYREIDEELGFDHDTFSSYNLLRTRYGRIELS